MKKQHSFDSNNKSGSMKLKRSVTFLGVFRLPSIKDLSEYFGNSNNHNSREKTYHEGTEGASEEKHTKKKKSKKSKEKNNKVEQFDSTEGTDSSSQDEAEEKKATRYVPPVFGRSSSEMTHTMHERREEIRRRMMEENERLEASKSMPSSPVVPKTQRKNKVGVAFAEEETTQQQLEKPPSKKFLSEAQKVPDKSHSPHHSPHHTPSPNSQPHIISRSPSHGAFTQPSPSQSSPSHSKPRTPPKESSPKHHHFVPPSGHLVTQAMRRQQQEQKSRRVSFSRSTSVHSALDGKMVKNDDDEDDEDEERAKELEVVFDMEGGDKCGSMSRSKSTIALAKHTKRKSRMSILGVKDVHNIDYVMFLPEVIWLRVAVLLAPVDLLKLRALSKKFTRYVNTNLVWASFSWRDFGNITVSSKNWREHYAQAFIRSKHPLTMEIKASKQTVHLNDRLFITSSIHNRSHKPVAIVVGTASSNSFETGALMRSGRGGSAISCCTNSNSRSHSEEPFMITIAPHETQSFLCRVVVTTHNDTVGLMVEDSTKNFLPLTRQDCTLWYDYKTSGPRKVDNLREDIIYWKGRVCSNKVPLTLELQKS